MYVKKIEINNYGCIEKFNYTTKFIQNHQPKPIVLVGKNGSGKTLLLTNIIDGLIELKREEYNKTKEVIGDNYYKVGKKDYISFGKNFSYVNIEYEEDGKNAHYMDLAVLDRDTFLSTEELSRFKNLDTNDSNFNTNGYFKRTIDNTDKKNFEKSIILYFPVHRYYQPSWYNKGNSKLEFETDSSLFVGVSQESIIKVNVLKEIEQWILDLMLDKYLYESVIKPIEISQADDNDNVRNYTINRHLGYSGKNSTTINLLNNILSTIYKTKFKNIDYARLAVYKKENRKIAINIKEKGSEGEIQLAPTFSHLSSGEVMLLSLFGSILKQYDKINVDGAKTLDDIKGIVIIDEIDLNLHIEYAKVILPELMSLFKGVQFIVTSHSPFFLLGMRDYFDSNCEFINMPYGDTLANIESFDEIHACYNVFLNDFDNLKLRLDKFENKLSEMTKPLIITEGKTDWKHFKNALKHFKLQGKYPDLDIVFLEYDEETKMGDGELESLLNRLSKIMHDKIIIGVFDNDSPIGKKYLKKDYIDFGNNVFGCCIPIPEHRKEFQGISVELLYRDDDLFRIDEKGRRIYLSSEFNKMGRYSKNTLINIIDIHKIKGKTDYNKSIIIDSGVFDEKGNSLALSKEEFARNIYEEKDLFLNMDLSSFEGVFNKIYKVLNKS